MPLLDDAGETLTGGGDALADALFGSGDPLYVTVVNAVLGFLGGIFDHYAEDWCGEVTDYGAAAGPVRYQRYCYTGFGARQEASEDGENWWTVASYTFGPPGVFDFLGLAQAFVERSLGLLHAYQEIGYFPTAGGIAYTSEAEQMSVIAVGHVKKLVVGMEQAGEPFQASFHFRKTTDATGANGEADLVTDFRAQAEPGLLACMSADVSINHYRVEDRISGGTTNGHLRTYIGAELAGNIGTAAAADTSNILQAAGCISWYTNFAGRGERGRTFIPGLPVPDFADNGRLTDDAVLAYEAFINALLGRYDGDTDAAADWQLVLWRGHVSGTGALENNPPEGAEGHVPPNTHPPFNTLAAQHGITLGKAQRVVRSLRRRGLGVRIGRGSGG